MGPWVVPSATSRRPPNIVPGEATFMDKDTNIEATRNRQVDSSEDGRISKGGGRGVYSCVEGDLPTAFINRMTPGSISVADNDDEGGRARSATDAEMNFDEAEEFVAMTWNACGMEQGVIEDVGALLGDEERWDACMNQEGPYAEVDTYKIVAGGHAFFISSCPGWKRSTAILLHRRWVDWEAKLNFKLKGQRVAYLDMVSGNMRLRLTSAHLPHSEHPDEDYEAAFLLLEDAVTEGRRLHMTNVVGIDANAVVGSRMQADSKRIIGTFGHERRNDRVSYSLVLYMA